MPPDYTVTPQCFYAGPPDYTVTPVGATAWKPHPMTLHNITLPPFHTPPLDPHFVPIAVWNRAYARQAKKPLAIAIERDGGGCHVHESHIISDKTQEAADRFHVERLVKLLLWAVGGYHVRICGDDAIAGHIRHIYSPQGARAFDAAFMARVYEKDFTVSALPYGGRPANIETPVILSRDLSGCRIGFDAGGSDRKVSAVIDGEAVYSEEVIWHPKENADPAYHYNEIVSAMKTAAAKMPRVDAIGVSSAGIYVNNRTMVASLFRKVAEADFERVVKNIYPDAARALGCDVLTVANDGDVTALAGAMNLNETHILGIAMGTSLAAGFVDGGGNITGRLNELAFAPIDAHDGAAVDEWSGDLGCGASYMSQDAVARLAMAAGSAEGIALPPNASPAEKLKHVQSLDIKITAAIFESIGCYLGHALALYRNIYDFRHVLLLGRVMSGAGGNIIQAQAEAVLRDDYPEITSVTLHLPDEKSRRVGQSIAAAALPQV